MASEEPLAELVIRLGALPECTYEWLERHPGGVDEAVVQIAREACDGGHGQLTSLRSMEVNVAKMCISAGEQPPSPDAKPLARGRRNIGVSEGSSHSLGVALEGCGTGD